MCNIQYAVDSKKISWDKVEYDKPSPYQLWFWRYLSPPDPFMIEISLNVSFRKKEKLVLVCDPEYEHITQIVVRKVPSDVSWSIWGLSSIWRIIFTTWVKSWVLCIVRKLQHLNSIQYCILLHPGNFLVFSSINFSTLDNLLIRCTHCL